MWRRVAWIGVIPAALLAVAGAYTTSLQFLGRFEAALEWVLRMSVPHLLGWAAAVALGVIAFVAHPGDEQAVDGPGTSTANAGSLVASKEDGGVS